MEPTAIQSGAGPLKPLETAMKSGTPPVGGTATLDAPDTGLKPQPRQKHFARQVLEYIADLRLTVALFALGLVLVFWGTLAQVDQGIFTVVQKYFRNPFIVWVPLKVVFFNNDILPGSIPFPGGWLIGGVMLVNLLAAHAIRFKLNWARAGIFMIHIGIIIMMLGELITGLYQVEGNIVIPKGQSSNTLIHPGTAELAIIKTIDAKKDQVVAIPIRFLKEPGAIVDDPAAPFKIEVVDHMVNTLLKNRRPNDRNIANRGLGLDFIAKSIPEFSGVDPNQKHDQPSVYLKLTGRDGKNLGIWMFSVHPAVDTQWVDPKGNGNKDEMYQVQLRFKETVRPEFSMHLTEFTHDVYPGTNTPKNFHSYIDLTDSAGTRKVEIYMNSPLYYNGETYYQASFNTDPTTGRATSTVLQVVRNPGWIMPYLSCLIVGVGLLVHFGQTLYRFLDRRVVR